MKDKIMGKKKIFLFFTVAFFATLLAVGIILISISCDGRWHANPPPGLLWDCFKLHFPLYLSIPMIILGGLGTAFFTVYTVLFYRKFKTTSDKKDKSF